MAKAKREENFKISGEGLIKRPLSRQPIPTDAQRVYRGIMFDVYQWQQHMFDDTHKTFEKIKRRDTINVIPITTDGKIMLAIQSQPGTQSFIGSFGGVIDEGESPLQAAKRELLEETGYRAKEFILWDAVQFVDKIDWVIYTFIAKGCHKIKKQHLDQGERITLQYVSFEEYLKIIMLDNYRDTEIAFKLLKLQQNPKKFEQVRRLFLSSHTTFSFYARSVK